MKRELSTEKEKLHTLELAVENLGKIGGKELSSFCCFLK